LKNSRIKNSEMQLQQTYKKTTSMNVDARTKPSSSSMKWITTLLALSSASALTTKGPHSVSRSFQYTANSIPLKLRTAASPRTKLLYAGENVEYDEFQIQNYSTPVHQRMKSKLSAFWSMVSPFKMSPTKDNEQQNVDEYLEFLDKRYHRLHDEDYSLAKPKPFSAWDWLFVNEESHDPQKSHEDALFILGVSELASEGLRKKQQHSIKSKRSTPVIDVTPKVRDISQKARGQLFGNKKMEMRKTNYKSDVRAILLKLKAKNKAFSSFIITGDNQLN